MTDKAQLLIWQVDTTQVVPWRPKYKALTLKQVVKKLNELDNFYDYVLNEKEVEPLVKKIKKNVES